MPRHYLHLGRVYEVVAASSVDAANAFMTDNDYGVLAIEGEEILMAPMESKGVPLHEVPSRIRDEVLAA